MANNRQSIAAPAWFNFAAVAAILFEAYGAYQYWLQVTTDPATLPIDQRDLVSAMPEWMTAAFAIAVWVGLAGAILLFLRRRAAAPLLLISFLAAGVQFGALLVVPQLSNLVGSDDLFVPFLIILVCYGIWHLAVKARKEGWLR